MRLVAAVLAVLGVPMLLVVTATSAWACSCAPMTLAEQVGRADVVFVGRAVEQAVEAPRETVSSLDPVTWTFTVERVHKGTPVGPQQVTTARSSASCGFEFTAGRSYLVVGTGAVSTGLCGGTRPAFAVTAADRAVLGEGTVPVVEPVVVPAPDPEPPSGAVWFVVAPVVILLGAAAWLYRRCRGQVLSGARLHR